MTIEIYRNFIYQLNYNNKNPRIDIRVFMT